MNAILVISPLPSYSTLQKALYLDRCREAGIPVEFWNVSSFTWGKELADKHGLPTLKERVFQSAADVVRALDAVDPEKTLCILQICEAPELAPVYDALRGQGFTTSIHLSRPFPRPAKSGGHLSLAVAKRRQAVRKCKKYFARLCGRPAVNAPLLAPDIVFCAGQWGPEYADSALTVPVNYMDYEEWLLNRGNAAHPAAESSCVFLDEALPMHPDFPLLFGQDNMNSAQAAAYYSSMCRLFDKIEQDLGLPVVIAAHPKAAYEGGEYAGRPVIQGETAACMRGAKLALGHMSSALAYAAMQQIPVFIVENRIARQTLLPHGEKIMDAWRSALDAPLIDSDCLPFTGLRLHKPNLKAYRNFIDMHLTWPQYRDTPCAPDFIRFIRQYEPSRR